MTASFVLTSLRPSTYPRGYASAIHSLRPRWEAFLNNLQDIVVMTLPSSYSTVFDTSRLVVNTLPEQRRLTAGTIANIGVCKVQLRRVYNCVAGWSAVGRQRGYVGRGAIGINKTRPHISFSNDPELASTSCASSANPIFRKPIGVTKTGVALRWRSHTWGKDSPFNLGLRSLSESFATVLDCSKHFIPPTALECLDEM